jgi:hypothetical protein
MLKDSVYTAAPDSQSKLKQPHPLLYWVIPGLLLLDAAAWIYWVVINANAMNDVDLTMLQQEPSLGWLMKYGIASIAIPVLLGILALKKMRWFPTLFFVIRPAQIVALYCIAKHYETIANGLPNYAAVFGPSPMKLAAVLMADASQSLFQMLFWFVITAVVVAWSYRRPKLYTR